MEDPRLQLFNLLEIVTTSKKVTKTLKLLLRVEVHIYIHWKTYKMIAELTGQQNQGKFAFGNILVTLKAAVFISHSNSLVTVLCYLP